MTDDSIEEKALELLNVPDWPYEYEPDDHPVKVLCRALEQHEAFRQEVSDALEEYKADQPYVWKQSASDYFDRFIIPKPKPDPIAEAWIEATGNTVGMEPLNAALEARGLEIREKNDD